MSKSLTSRPYIRCIQLDGSVMSRIPDVFRYFQRTGSPSHNDSMVKYFSKCNPPDLKFYVIKLTYKSIPIYGVILIFSCFVSLL